MDSTGNLLKFSGLPFEVSGERGFQVSSLQSLLQALREFHQPREFSFEFGARVATSTEAREWHPCGSSRRACASGRLCLAQLPPLTKF